MFGWGRKAAVEKRAKQIARMVLLVIDGLQTKTYEQSVEIFSNPGNVPSTRELDNRELSFQIRFSSACWYHTVAVYPRGPDETDQPHFYMLIPTIAWRSSCISLLVRKQGAMHAPWCAHCKRRRDGRATWDDPLS